MKKIANNIEVIAVSKYHSIEEIKLMHEQFGYFNFAENKAQDLKTKALALPDFKWFFIGNIQSNKIKTICTYSDEIQSVSSLKHLNIIEKFALELGKTMSILLQLNLTGEINKGGMSITQAQNILKDSTLFPNLMFNGIMIVGPSTGDPSPYFQEAHEIYESFKIYNSKFNVNISKLSMGMSADYEIALNNGSNCIRLGTILFSQLQKK